MSTRTHQYPRTNRPATMHRIRPGFYVQRENATTVLHVFKYCKKWYYARRGFQVLSSKVAALYLSTPGYAPGYPTRAMAISAAKGNRVS